MNHQNQSSVTTSHVSLTSERRHFDHLDGTMNISCRFDGPSRGLHLDGSNETSHYDGPSKGNHLEKDFGVDHFDGSYTVLSNLWHLETIGIKVEEHRPVEIFLRNVKMNENTNRHETSLTFKDGFALLPDNYELCRKCLMSLYKTLKNDPELLESYDKMFREQLSLGVIEQIDTPNSKPGQVHYLPHHPVICFNKKTARVCAVFGASAELKGNSSLNDCLHKGPQHISLIFDILLRFHFYGVALTANIEKAFLQVGIKEPNEEFLRFFWFDDVFTTEPKIIWNRFACVIFRVTSSPFLLNGTFRKHTVSYNSEQ